jgi:DNA polymerase III epsilon subunit-like protein
MRFVSIDIETTGLDPNTCQVLEIGAVIEDDRLGLNELPTFRYRILRDNYVGEPYALSMHKDLFKDLANATRNTTGGIQARGVALMNLCWYGLEREFATYFAEWLLACDIDPTKFVAAGKNFAHFDEPFLKTLTGTGIVRWHHRILDPGSMYVRPTDEFMPDTNECCRRAGLDPAYIPGDEHTSIHDALVVVALIRSRWIK